MKSILLATDFSDRSERAAGRAIALASVHGAKLHLIHIIDDDLPKPIADEYERAAETALGEMAEAAKRKGAACTALLKRGEAHAAINEAAAETGAELVVVGSHRRDPMRNAFIGTTAERMIRAGTTPVLVVRSDEPKDYGCAVVAVDLAEEGIGHIERFQELGLAANNCLVPVFAYEAGQFHLMRRAGASLAELEAMFEEEKKTVEPTVRKLMSDAGLDPDQGVVKPILYNTPDTILKAAAEAKADLLVVGARRKTAFKRFTLGSVSEACLLRAEIDLLVFPPEE